MWQEFTEPFVVEENEDHAHQGQIQNNGGWMIKIHLIGKKILIWNNISDWDFSAMTQHQADIFDSDNNDFDSAESMSGIQNAIQEYSNDSDTEDNLSGFSFVLFSNKIKPRLL